MNYKNHPSNVQRSYKMIFSLCQLAVSTLNQSTHHFFCENNQLYPLGSQLDCYQNFPLGCSMKLLNFRLCIHKFERFLLWVQKAQLLCFRMYYAIFFKLIKQCHSVGRQLHSKFGHDCINLYAVIIFMRFACTGFLGCLTLYYVS